MNVEDIAIAKMVFEYDFETHGRFDPEVRSKMYVDHTLRTLMREIEPGLTLDQFLYGESSGLLLGEQSPLSAVVLLDGRFHSKYEGGQPSNDVLTTIGVNSGIVPVLYMRMDQSPLVLWRDHLPIN